MTTESLSDSGGPTLSPLMLWAGGTAVVSIIALGASQGQNGWTAAVGIGVVIFLVAFTGGAMLGFLFGIPRVLARAGAAEVTTSPTAAAGERQRQMLQSNTNLERISDWLTTLLIGVGLSQLHNINDALRSFRDYIATTALVFTGPGGRMHAGALPAVAPSFLIAGAVVGFLLMYLYTRTSLVRLLHLVEIDLSSRVQKHVKVEAEMIAQRTGSIVATQVSQTGAASVDDALSLMYSALQVPDEYESVIRLANNFLNSRAAERPEFWFYLAVAYARKLSITKDANPDEGYGDRINALDAARRAVRIDETFRRRLRFNADPDGRERDLAVLWEDPEFERIIR